jgi:hypothetical protein
MENDWTKPAALAIPKDGFTKPNRAGTGQSSRKLQHATAFRSALRTMSRPPERARLTTKCTSVCHCRREFLSATNPPTGRDLPNYSHSVCKRSAEVYGQSARSPSPIQQ